MQKFEELIRLLFEQERIYIESFDTSKPRKVIINYRNDFYFGQVRELYPEYSTEIVNLNFYKKSLPVNIYQEIKRIDNRLELIANPLLDLTRPTPTVRLIENRLTLLTEGQSEYIKKALIEIYKN